jgi:23S rRNA pseudouridine955/2504/2580 synthase
VRYLAAIPSRSAPAPKLDFARWILWQDDGLIAIDKPAGVLSQGGEGAAGINVVDLARAYLGRKDVGVLHRVDRNVSGVVLVAKEPRAAGAMTKLFQKGAVERVYRAVVRGEPKEDAFSVRAWLAKDEAYNQVSAVDEPELAKLSASERGAFRPARTDVTVIARTKTRLGPCAVLDVRPITGRSHQIRAHLVHVGLPIVGDPKYGVLARGLNRPLLHARLVAFTHPKTRAHVVIEAPIPWPDAQVLALAPAAT